MVGAPVTDDSTDGGRKSGEKKKGEKKGFKVDRYERYQQMRSKKQGGKDARKSRNSVGRVKSVVFDETARRDFLLGMHKRKNERRVKAFVDAKQKIRRDNAKVRRAQREEARQSYNRYAKVPILPNFSFKLPTGENENENEKEKDEMRQTVHAVPAAMTGEKAAAPGARLDDELVTVEVKPLFAHAETTAETTAAAAHATKKGKGKGAALPANDFSDLPQAVVEEMMRIKQETKGPARTKARVHMLRELQKIQKIKKHSRKGHGKKNAKGKKRNR